MQIAAQSYEHEAHEAQEAEEPQSRDKVAYRQLSLSNSCQIVKQKKEPLIWREIILFYP